METATRVLLVDDHEIVRDGLKLLLGRQANLAVVGEAADGVAALRQAELVAPDLAIVDLNMPELSGLELIRCFLERFPDLRIVVLSVEADHHLVQEALRLGVRGYVLKGNASAEILQAVEVALRGQVYFSPEIATAVADGYRKALADGHRSPLSERETGVLRLLADGKSSKEIAETLGVSVTTVDTHRHNIMKRLGVFSVAELTKYAVKQGLTKL